MVEDIVVLTDDLIAALRCPVCARPLHRAGGLRCDGGHHFDFAKQGYIHLGTGAKLPEGDTAAMVEARQKVLSAGLFAPLEQALTRNVPTSARRIVDLGAGTGHYLAKILPERDAEAMAFDVSKPALRKAAKAHERMGAVLADTWARLPLADASVDVLLNVFAPRNGPQMRRVLKPDGILIVATPTQNHLRELREAAGLLDVDESKQDRLNATLSGFQRTKSETVRWPLNLTAEQAENLVLMGPNAFHHRRGSGEIDTTAEVTVSTWTGRPLPTHPADRGVAR